MAAAMNAASLETVACQTDILCPRMTEAVRPSIFLAGQLERVTATLPHFSLEQVLRSATSCAMTHSPTLAYHVRDAVVRDGSVYAGAYRHCVVEDGDASPIDGEEARFTDRALVSTYMGTKYFGPWLRDECAMYLLAESFAPPLGLRRPLFHHQPRYAQIFGQAYRPVDRARIDHLVIFQDYAQNPHKRARSRTLRSRLLGLAPNNRSAPYVYLRRGLTGSNRIIENEDEIVETLAHHGFAIVDVANDPLDDIITALLNARIIVSVEGSHVAHCAFTCSDDAALLLLQPPDRFSLNHREWSAPLGIAFGFVVGSAGSGGYRFSAGEILATMELMLARR
jgi:capsular polysaccharide biosynthesis protein